MSEVVFKGNETDLSAILISAVRYALGRKTYIVQWTCSIVLKNIEILDLKNLTVMIRDIEQADDYGDICDQHEWNSLLTALKERLKKL